MHSELSKPDPDGDLRRKVGELERQLAESRLLEQATAEVLQVISRPDFDLQAVLTSLVENAVRLCDADEGFIFRLDGDLYRLAANYGTSQEFRGCMERHPMRPERGTVVGAAAVERATVHVADVLTDPEYS